MAGQMKITRRKLLLRMFLRKVRPILKNQNGAASFQMKKQCGLYENFNYGEFRYHLRF